jgi:hypothetical protein
LSSPRIEPYDCQEATVKKVMLFAAIVAIAAGLSPSSAAQAQGLPYDIVLSACRASDGTYTATLTAYNDGSFWTDLHVIDENRPGPWGECMGSVPDGWTYAVEGLSEGSEFSAYYWVYPEDLRTIRLDSSLPSCGASSTAAKPLFDMWLLTGGGKYCIMISDTHPSIERQKAVCFPGEDWVAADAPCSGGVYAGDYWVCDSLGYERAPLSDLMDVYRRWRDR